MQTNRLISIIDEKGLKRTSLAKYLGITDLAFRNKLHGITEFKVSEIEKLGSYLGLSQEDFFNIFFSC